MKEYRDIIRFFCIKHKICTICYGNIASKNYHTCAKCRIRKKRDALREIMRHKTIKGMSRKEYFREYERTHKRKNSKKQSIIETNLAVEKAINDKA